MASRSPAAFDAAVRGGEIPLGSREALGALEGALLHARGGARTGAGGQYLACRTAWSRSVWRGHPLIAHLPDEDERDDDHEGGTAARDAAEEEHAGVSRAASGAAASHSNGSGGGGGGGGGDALSAFLDEHVGAARRPGDTLAALGVDSLDEVQLRAGVQRRFGVRAPLALFVAPGRTVGELEAALRRLIDQNKK